MICVVLLVCLMLFLYCYRIIVEDVVDWRFYDKIVFSFFFYEFYEIEVFIVKEVKGYYVRFYERFKYRYIGKVLVCWLRKVSEFRRMCLVICLRILDLIVI